MLHPLVEQFGFTRSEWLRGPRGISVDEYTRVARDDGGVAHDKRCSGSLAGRPECTALQRDLALSGRAGGRIWVRRFGASPGIIGIISARLGPCGRCWVIEDRRRSSPISRNWRLNLDPANWRTAGWFEGTVVRIDPYSAHRSFSWVEMDVHVELARGGRTNIVAVLNPKHIVRI